MFSRTKGYFLIIALFSLVYVSLPGPNMYHNFSNNNYNMKSNNNMSAQAEKQQEKDYIYQDALLTTEMSLSQMVLEIKSEIHRGLNFSQIEQKYPEVLDISYIFDPSVDLQDKDYKLIKGNKSELIHALTPIKGNKILQIDIKSNIFIQIEKKQQLRMFTVTYLQNNKWKTNPTRYSPRKKLSSGLEEALPDLKPKLEEKGISHYIKNEVVIKFKKNVGNDQIQQVVSKHNINIKKRRDNFVVANCPRRSTKTLIKELENNKETSQLIEYVEPHFIYLTNDNDVGRRVIPNDSLYLDYQWNLPIILTEQGWELTKGRENVIIAVVDTGVDFKHPEFKNKLVDGINIVNSSRSPMDDDGHGTHVAGIISANTNNNEGIAGITWYNKIMPIKVLDQSGAGTLSDVAEGIFWATDHGAKVINLSLGNYAESKYLHDAVKYAYSKDVVLVAASGNDNTDKLGYPAAYPEVLAVSAIDPYENRAQFSNYGNYIDVVAPGVNIPSTYPNNQYAALSGTSMASPHVAGLAGLIRAQNPYLTNKEVISIIRKTASDLGAPGKDTLYGYGQINIKEAINAAIPNEQDDSLYFNWLRSIIRRILGQNI